MSTKNLAKYLKKFDIPIYGIWGSLKNKNPEKLIKNFKGIFKKIVTIKIPDERNALSSKILFKIAKKNGFISQNSKDLRDALKRFPQNKKKLIVIFGSLYLAGYVLSIN